MHQVAPSAEAAIGEAGMPPDSHDLLQRLDQLVEIGVALSGERDIDKLVESILVAAKSITNADGGTLYRMQDGRDLRFEIMRNDTLGIALGGTSGGEIPFMPVPLTTADGATSRATRWPARPTSPLTRPCSRLRSPARATR